MQGTLKDIFVLSQQHYIAGWHFAILEGLNWQPGKAGQDLSVRV